MSAKLLGSVEVFEGWHWNPEEGAESLFWFHIPPDEPSFGLQRYIGGGWLPVSGPISRQTYFDVFGELL